MENPYESPETVSESQKSEREFPFDVGKVTGRYLQTLAALSVGTMLFDWIVFDDPKLDFSFIFFWWGGVGLLAHSYIARRWVIGVCVFAIIFCVGITANSLLSGTENMTVRVVFEIDDPTVADVAFVSGVIAVSVAIPLVMLCTRQARIEFAKPLRALKDRRQPDLK